MRSLIKNLLLPDFFWVTVQAQSRAESPVDFINLIIASSLTRYMGLMSSKPSKFWDFNFGIIVLKSPA